MFIIHALHALKVIKPIAFFVFSVGGGVVIGLTYEARRNYSKTHEPVYLLKNALLAYALHKTTINADDVPSSKTAHRYDDYDGSKLPPMTGYTLPNACFTYILERPRVRLIDSTYTEIMESKFVAIEKFIEKNLDTDDKVLKLFVKFCETNKDGRDALENWCKIPKWPLPTSSGLFGGVMQQQHIVTPSIASVTTPQSQKSHVKLR